MTKNKIGVSLFSFQSNSINLFFGDSYTSFLNSIKYKKHIGPHAIRLGAEYRDSWAAYSGDVSGEEKYTEGRFNSGYQFTFCDSRIRPYLAADLFCMMAKLDLEFMGGYLGVIGEKHLSIYGIGYAPTLGVYFALFETLALSWEGNFEVMYYNEKGTFARSAPPGLVTSQQVNRHQQTLALNPVKSLSLNYGF